MPRMKPFQRRLLRIKAQSPPHPPRFYVRKLTPVTTTAAAVDGTLFPVAERFGNRPPRAAGWEWGGIRLATLDGRTDRQTDGSTAVLMAVLGEERRRAHA